jgi:6-pyruvoyltetrahydropterin/6-carboxytetrahydropterin synthase
MPTKSGEIMASSRPRYRLTVTSDFSSSHQLRHYQGKCEELHGHNFGVQVEVEGESLDEKTGMLIDFKELKSKLASVLDRLDHSHLNELEPFRETNPSSENIARYIYQQMARQLEDHQIQVRMVSVSEKESSKATYSELESF